MSMLAGGVRGDLVDSGAGGFGLAFKADALWVGTEVTPEVDPKIMGLPRYFWERGSLRSVNEYP